MLRFFRQITFEPQIKRMYGLAQIFSFLSCRALLRHLQSTVEDSGELDFSPSTSSGIEVTSQGSSPSLNPINPRF